MQTFWSRWFKRSRYVPVDPRSLIVLPDLVDNAPALDERRFIALEGGVNFRDIGGYVAADGRRVRWGKVYRSGLLSKLTAHDLDTIKQMNIRLICDLRSQQEVRSAPETLADFYLEHIPIEAEDTAISRLRALLFDRSRLTDMLVYAYTETMIKKNPHVFGLIFRRLADADYLPALIRCSAGKDRTGIVIALLLLTLGVPEDTILADYSLSNFYYEDFKTFAYQAMGPLGFFGITGDALQPLLIADPEILRRALAYIRSQYGSLDAYLRNQAGIDEDTLKRLQHNLLEPVD
ncbi:MAG: tyrosine-protein phosphatase [Anaerolineae bacterium]|nr:tyrosine-protein phosphatase [Anaerolineae bacterium]